MIGYITLGTNDLKKAGAFYDALLAEFGAKRVFEMDRGIFYGSGAGGPMFAVMTPYDGKTATGGNGTMIALNAPDRDAVGRIYDKALSLGARDEGAPGPRGGGGFYGGYFRDGDGNKFAVFVMGK